MMHGLSGLGLPLCGGYNGGGCGMPSRKGGALCAGCSDEKFEFELLRDSLLECETLEELRYWILENILEKGDL